jgi:hypothetical protein
MWSSTSILPGPNTSPRRTARRLSYHLKNRLSKYSLPIGLGVFVTSLFLYFTYSNGSYMPSLPSSRIHSRDEARTYNAGGFIKEEGSRNGLSFLDLDEDELIAEDDLFWDSYQEKQAKSKMEQKEIEQMESRRKEVIKTNKVHSLRALIWWISQGGVLPTGWDVPTKDTVLKLGSGGMKKMLEGIDGGVVGDEIFQEGWADFAKDRYRVVVFSKVSSRPLLHMVQANIQTYCPYSKNAKRILENYQLTPAAYIIELDQRCMSPLPLLILLKANDTSRLHLHSNLTIIPNEPPNSPKYPTRFPFNRRIRRYNPDPRRGGFTTSIPRNGIITRMGMESQDSCQEAWDG